MTTTVNQMTTTINNLSNSVSQLNTRVTAIENESKVTKLSELTINNTYVSSSSNNWNMSIESGSVFYYTIFELGSRVALVKLTTVGTSRTRYLCSNMTPEQFMTYVNNRYTGTITGLGAADLSNNVTNYSIITNNAKYLYIYEGNVNGTVTAE